MSYRFILDKARIFFDGERYHVKMTKVIAPISDNLVEFIYSRIDVSIVPDHPYVASEFYRENPISLENLSFRALLDGKKPLRFNILHQYPSNIELAILLHREDSTLPSPLRPGMTARIIHEIHPTMYQWGNWLQREVRMPTERLSVSLLFPSGMVDCGATSIVGGHHRPLSPSIAMIRRKNAQFDQWYWSIDDPPTHNRYRFQWDFIDERHADIREDIVARYVPFSNDFFLSADGSEAKWFDQTLRFSPTQAEAINFLFKRIRSDFMINEEALLEEIGAKSRRVRDLFKNKPALLKTLIEYTRGRCKLNTSHEAFRRYLDKLTQ